MVPETTNSNAALLPVRHDQQELFICDVADAVLKDIMQHMEHPFYSLSKKPQTAVRRYEHNGNWIEITPSVKGQATIYDKDILIYCISQIMAKLNRGEQVSRRVRIRSRDLLIFTNRGTSGRDYQALKESIDRLAGTQISTNIRVGDEEHLEFFGLIDSASLRRKYGLDGRLMWCEVTISDWVFDAIRAKEVLAIHADYFRLKKPLERRVYELARKHCGTQPQWKISLEKLLKKSGSQSSMKKFRHMVKQLSANDHLPGYSVWLDADDMVQFHNREAASDAKPRDGVSGIHLREETYARAKELAPRWDIHLIEQYWREKDHEQLRDPDAAFLGFCRNWYATRGEA